MPVKRTGRHDAASQAGARPARSVGRFTQQAQICYAPRGEKPSFAARGDKPSFAARGEKPSFSGRGEKPSFGGATRSRALDRATQSPRSRPGRAAAPAKAPPLPRRDAIVEKAAAPPPPMVTTACKTSPLRLTKPVCASTASSRRAFRPLVHHIQRIIRKGEVRLNGKRVQPKDRIARGPGHPNPAAHDRRAAPETRLSADDQKTRDFLKSITLHEDADVLVSTSRTAQRSGRLRHHAPLDGMLEVLRGPGPTGRSAPRASPRQGHRGLSARRQDALCGGRARENLPFASARKIYWALTAACRSRVRVASRPSSPRRSAWRSRSCASPSTGEEGASHAVTYYAWWRPLAPARLGFAQARHRTHASAPRPYGACRQSDRRRSENTSRSRTGSCPAACRTACICSRAA